MIPITGQPTGIHRIALTADAQKIDRMMLGPAGVVQLWPADKQLVIGEGLETVLAAATQVALSRRTAAAGMGHAVERQPGPVSRDRRRRVG